MARFLITTPAFLVRSQATGEASKRIRFLTPDYGMVVGHAQGLRRQGSKLRAHLGDLSLSKITLTRGKEAWRILGAEAVLTADSFRHLSHSGARRLLARTATLIDALVRDEDGVRELFSELLSFLSFTALRVITDRQALQAEQVFFFRALSILGYMRERRETAALRHGFHWDDEVFLKWQKAKWWLAPQVKEALAASNLFTP